MTKSKERDSASVVTVMTQNVYFGTGLAPIFTATSLVEVVAAVAAAWQLVEASGIDERAGRIAGVIAAEMPDLVALQEAAQWLAGSAGAMMVKYDFISSILQALHAQGLFYVPIAITRNFDRAAPMDGSGSQVRLVDRDAVLLKVGGGAAQVRPYNIRSEHYATLMPIASPILGSLMVPRGWIAIDATIGNSNFRFINTHLESYDARVQMAQAAELVAGPGDISLPLIMAGDFNSNANQKPGDAPANENTPTYRSLMADGLQDVWASVNPGDPGNTCCQRGDLANEASALFERIDLMLTRGSVTPIAAKLVADQPNARTPGGRWPSDHAGIVAQLRIE